MKKIYLFILLVVLVLASVVVLRLALGGDEGKWVCDSGQWVRQGNPSSAMPTSGCGQVDPGTIATSTDGNGQATSSQMIEVTSGKGEKIRLRSPLPGATISSPLKISGEAPGNWYFEASFPVELVDGRGKVLAQHYGQAQSDWMTTEYVPFVADIEFEIATDTPGLIILKKDNPSGLPEHDDQIRVPVVFAPSRDKIAIKVFFGLNMSTTTVDECAADYYAYRYIPRTLAVGRAALEELLKGPTAGEKSRNFFTSINDGVKLKSLKIENGVAYVDFDQRIQYQLGGSCRVSAIRAQIENTLRQFETVRQVVISVEGDVEEALQP